MTVIRTAFASTPETGEIQAVAEGVYWLKMPLPFELDHINLYLLEEADGWNIVDCGLAGQHTEKIWQQLAERYFSDKPVKRVIATHFHPDHLGCAGWLCNHFNVALYISDAEYRAARRLIKAAASSNEDRFQGLQLYLQSLGVPEAQVPTVIGATEMLAHAYKPLPDTYHSLQQNQVLRINNESWHIAISQGHSPGHVTLYNEKQNLLISGDQILPRISSNVSVSIDNQRGNPLKDWLNGLKDKRKLPKSALVLPAHDAPFYGLHERIEELETEHKRMLDKVIEHSSDANTVYQLAHKLYSRKLNNFTLLLALGETLAHLHYQLELGLIVRNETDQQASLYQCTAG